MSYEDIFCPYCGNRVYANFIENKAKHIRICKHCGTAHYTEKQSSPELILEMEKIQIAHAKIKSYHFGEARDIFISLIQDHHTAMPIAAKWGYLLAKYGIIYIINFFKQNANGEYSIEPIYCLPDYSYHRKFMEEQEYKSIIDSLPYDSQERKLYINLANSIQTTLDQFNEIVSNIENDIFICVKINQMTRKTPFNQAETEDFKKAKEIYNYLTEECHKKVFLNVSPREITEGTEMTLFPNLLKSKKMLLISSNEEYLSEVPWIKNDWMRWLYFDNYHMRKSNLLIYIPEHYENPQAICPHELQGCPIYTDREQLIAALCQETQDEITVKKPGFIRSAQYRYSIPYGMEDIDKAFIEKKEALHQILEIALPNSVKNIKSDTFRDCSNLEKLFLDDHIEQIEENAFLNCSKLKIIFDGTRKTWATLYQPKTRNHYREIKFLKEDGWIYYGEKKISVPYEVDGISDGAYSNSPVTRVELHNRIKTIGEYAFAGCKRLEKIVIPHGVVKIGRNAFQNCINLQEVILPDTLTYIDAQAFAGCENLRAIHIPDSVVQIGAMAFSGCENLTDVTVPRKLKSIAIGLFQKCSRLETLSLPDFIVSIGEFAFYECYSLSNFRLPKEITVISKNAFCRCNSLSFLEIPEKVTKIEKSAFAHWDIQRPRQTVAYAAAEMPDDKKIIIPSSVQCIEEDVFFDSDGIVIEYKGTKEQWNHLNCTHENIRFMNQTGKGSKLNTGNKKGSSETKTSNSGTVAAIWIILAIIAIGAVCIFLIFNPFASSEISVCNEIQIVFYPNETELFYRYIPSISLINQGVSTICITNGL